MTNIYFVRHANSSYSTDELNRPLSEKGINDAKKVTELLSHENISKIISSPYKRAIQSIEGIANHFEIPISMDEGFEERKIADSYVTNFDEMIFKYWEDFNFSLHGGETGYVAQARGVQSLENVLNKYSGESIVIGTHGNIMVLIMNYYDKKYNYDFWKSLSMPDIYRLSFEDGILVTVKRIWK